MSLGFYFWSMLSFPCVLFVVCLWCLSKILNVLLKSHMNGNIDVIGAIKKMKEIHVRELVVIYKRISI